MSLVLDDVLVAAPPGSQPRFRGSLRCGPGITVVVGRNGAGKSTLLDAAAGLLRPDSGSVRWEGVDVTSMPSTTRARLIASLGQRPPDAPLAGLTVVERIAQGLVPRRGPRASITPEVRSHINGVLTALSLEALAERRLGQLSGGERQRAHLGRAIIDDDAKVLILDEPFAGLDHRSALQAVALLQARAERQTILISVHDLSLAHALGGTLVGLRGGRIDINGPMAEMLPKAGPLFGDDVRVVVDGAWSGVLRRRPEPHPPTPSP